MSSLEFLGQMTFVSLCFEALLKKRSLGNMTLIHKHVLGRRDGRIAQWPRGSPVQGMLLFFTTLAAHSRRASVLVYNLRLSNYSEVRRLAVNIVFRKTLEK